MNESEISMAKRNIGNGGVFGNINNGINGEKRGINEKSARQRRQLSSENGSMAKRRNGGAIGWRIGGNGVRSARRRKCISGEEKSKRKRLVAASAYQRPKNNQSIMAKAAAA
jgi:hypothetical protein